MSSQPDDAAEGQANVYDQSVAVSVDEHTARLKAEAHTSTAKEKLSAYFTIAAAAFGLISDGCNQCSSFHA